jgi:hypothetical protein
MTSPADFLLGFGPGYLLVLQCAASGPKPARNKYRSKLSGRFDFQVNLAFALIDFGNRLDWKAPYDEADNFASKARLRVLFPHRQEVSHRSIGVQQRESDIPKNTEKVRRLCIEEAKKSWQERSYQKTGT